MTRPGSGLLIAFCGLDGSGKTTQATILARRLGATVLRPVTDLFREDRDVRSFLHHGEPPENHRFISEIALLGAADRLRQYRTRIGPRLARGETVIMDRYVLSTYAWAYARGLTDLAWLRALNRNLPDPDLTIVLDVAPAEAVRRIVARGDEPRWEELDEPRLERVRAAFTRHCAPDDVHVLDGTRPVDVLADAVFHLVEPLLPATTGYRGAQTRTARVQASSSGLA